MLGPVIVGMFGTSMLEHVGWALAIKLGWPIHVTVAALAGVGLAGYLTYYYIKHNGEDSEGITT